MSPTETAHRKPTQQRPPTSPHLPYSAFHTSLEASSSRSKGAASDPSHHLQTFADERKYAATLPRIEGEGPAITAFSSYSSSPYTSPKTASRPRQGDVVVVAAAGTMDDIVLPPIQAAVPSRRGAVSGASSGPLMPFPPIRPSFEDDEFPSRGPSPTLGKRGSFSMGHSNHVPPGPDVQLPTPVLSGSGERRGGLMSIPGYINGNSHPSYHTDGLDGRRGSTSAAGGPIRMLEEGSTSSHYQPIAQRPIMHWPPHKAIMTRSESAEVVATAPLSVFHSSSPPVVPTPSRHGQQFNDDTHRHYSHVRVAPPPPPPPPPAAAPSHSYHPPSHHPLPPHAHESLHRASSGGYQYDYHREGSALSPGSSHGMLHGESSMSPRTKQEQQHYTHDDNQKHDAESSANGKRPRSAPRVMSTQPRIFACTQCPARFARNHDLKRHQRGHLSVRPYPCNWCDKSFSRKDALKRHILVKGCGKDGKGGESGKGDGKNKRSRLEDSEKRSSHNHDSSGGDQDDNHYDVKDEHGDAGSEEHHHHQQQQQQQQRQQEQQHKGGGHRRPIQYHNEEPRDALYSRQVDLPRTQSYPSVKNDHSGSRYSESMSQYKSNSFHGPSGGLSSMSALHGRRPSASVA